MTDNERKAVELFVKYHAAGISGLTDNLINEYLESEILSIPTVQGYIEALVYAEEKMRARLMDLFGVTKNILHEYRTEREQRLQQEQQKQQYRPWSKNEFQSRARLLRVKGTERTLEQIEKMHDSSPNLNVTMSMQEIFEDLEWYNKASEQWQTCGEKI